MEISQKFKDQEFGILDELGRAEHVSILSFIFTYILIVLPTLKVVVKIN